MASPLPTIAVTGHFTTLANTAAEGYVTLTPVAARTVGDDWIIVGATVTGYVRDGLLATTIIADSDQLATDLYVRVVEHLDDTPAETYIVRPQGSLLDLATAPRVATPPPGQAYIPASALGQANGVATLGPDGILTASQRPAGGGGGVTDHGALTGLGDDDHTQYLNVTRGDSRYYVQSWVDTALFGKENTGVAAAGDAAHVAAANPHPQYVTDPELASALVPYATTTALTAGLATKENTGVAATAVAAHVAATDPHPQYLTPAEAGTILDGYATDAELGLGLATKAPVVHTHAVADVTGLQSTLDTKATVTVTDALDTRVDALEAVDPLTQTEGDARYSQLGHVHTIAQVTSLQATLDGKQPVDADLTAIAALAPADGSLMQRISGAWSGRTLAGLKTDLALDQVDNTSDLAKPISTATATALAGKAGTALTTALDTRLVAVEEVSLVCPYLVSEYGMYSATGPDPLSFMATSTWGNADHNICMQWVPAGKTIGTVAVAVRAASAYSATGTPSQVKVYDTSGALVGSSPDDPGMWLAKGWSLQVLTSTIAAQSTGRWVYVGISGGGFSGHSPAWPTAISGDWPEGTSTGHLVGRRRAFYSGSSAGLPASINPATYGTITSYAPLIGLIA